MSKIVAYNIVRKIHIVNIANKVVLIFFYDHSGCSSSLLGGNQVYPLLLPGASYPRTDPPLPPQDLKTSPSHSPLPMASKGLLFHDFKVPIYTCAFPLAPNKSHALPN